MPLTGREKAMMLLSLLESKGSEQILQHLTPESSEKIAGGVGNLPHPSPEALQEIFQEVTDEFGGGGTKAYVQSRSGESAQSDKRRPLVDSHPIRELAQRFQNEKSPVLAFVAGELTAEDQELFLDQFPEKRREIEQLMKQRKKTPLTDSIREALMHGPH